MKKISFTILFSLLFSFAFSQKENALLWKISGNGLKYDSYLFGTVHVLSGNENDYPVFNTMSKYFNNCSELILEINLSQVNFSDYNILSKMVLKSDSTIDRIMDPQEYSQAVTFWRDTLLFNSQIIEQLRVCKPVFTSSFFMTVMFDNYFSPEELLMQRAQSAGMSLYGLETPEYQFDLLNKIPLSEQINMLVIDSQHFETMTDEYNNLIKIYKSGDFSALSSVINDDMDFTKYIPDFLESRNHDWTNKIIDEISHNPCFIAVGAGHLASLSSLTTILESKGYLLTPIRN